MQRKCHLQCRFDVLSSHNGAVENYKTSKADPENSERGGRDTFPLVSYIDTFYFSKNSIKKVIRSLQRKRGGCSPLGPPLNPPLNLQHKKSLNDVRSGAFRRRFQIWKQKSVDVSLMVGD